MKTESPKLLVCAVLIAALLGFPACDVLGDGSREEAVDDFALIGPEWRLTSLNGANIDREEEHPWSNRKRARYSVIFRDTTFQGVDEGYRVADVVGYPNLIGATYRANTDGGADRLVIQVRSSTLIGRPDDSKEEAFMKALDTAEWYKIKGHRLFIRYDEGKVMAFQGVVGN